MREQARQEAKEKRNVIVLSKIMTMSLFFSLSMGGEMKWAVNEVHVHVLYSIQGDLSTLTPPALKLSYII